MPCFVHSLNLVATAIAESCTETCRFYIVLQELYDFFTSSTQRKIVKSKTVKCVNLTRWSAREDAFKILRDSWHELLKIFGIAQGGLYRKECNAT